MYYEANKACNGMLHWSSCYQIVTTSLVRVAAVTDHQSLALHAYVRYRAPF